MNQIKVLSCADKKERERKTYYISLYSNYTGNWIYPALSRAIWGVSAWLQVHATVSFADNFGVVGLFTYIVTESPFRGSYFSLFFFFIDVSMVVSHTFPQV